MNELASLQTDDIPIKVNRFHAIVITSSINLMSLLANSTPNHIRID